MLSSLCLRLDGVFAFIEKNADGFYIRKEGGPMLQTKFQNILFPAMTAIFMAYGMIVYRIAIHSSEGLSNQTFFVAWKEFPVEGVLVFLLAFFTATPIAKNFAFRIVNRKEDHNLVWNCIVWYCKNCIMAYPLQMLFAGPFVRTVFRMIFRKQLQQT